MIVTIRSKTGDDLTNPPCLIFLTLKMQPLYIENHVAEQEETRKKKLSRKDNL